MPYNSEPAVYRLHTGFDFEGIDFTADVDSREASEVTVANSGNSANTNGVWLLVGFILVAAVLSR